METVTFSTLDYMTGPSFVALLKRYAKDLKSQSVEEHKLAWFQDQVAHKLGYQNWSVLHKNVVQMGWYEVAGPQGIAKKAPALWALVESATSKTIIVEDAIDTMKSWARAKYTPLVEFAYRDSESPTGYAWPSVEMEEELSSEFAGQFPDDLIEEVGYQLDAEEGPWGLEKYD